MFVLFVELFYWEGNMSRGIREGKGQKGVVAGTEMCSNEKLRYVRPTFAITPGTKAA